MNPEKIYVLAKSIELLNNDFIVENFNVEQVIRSAGEITGWGMEEEILRDFHGHKSSTFAYWPTDTARIILRDLLRVEISKGE